VIRQEIPIKFESENLDMEVLGVDGGEGVNRQAK
jgi:hypothetical protein